jgi:2-isopropylmalate synthase
VSDEDVTPEREHYRLATLKVVSETGTVPHARVAMRAGEAELHAEASGDGPVDAVFKAIERMASSSAQLQLFSVNAITTGTDAQGEVTVRLEREGRIVNGNGADTDIIVASAKAYINALNKLRASEVRLNPQLAA